MDPCIFRLYQARIHSQMTRDIIDINDFTVLVETASTDGETITDACSFDEPVIGVAFYGSGNVALGVQYGENLKQLNYTKGLALSFYADESVKFVHTISSSQALECVLIVTSIRQIDQLPFHEGDLFSEMLSPLVNPQDNYIEGPSFLMPPEMQTVVEQVFHSQYEGKAKMMFFRSQMTLLLAHFFGQLSMLKETGIPEDEKEKLHLAKEILSDNLDTPPSLTELSRQIGLNTFKLKKDFKALFGVPVFKYLQNQRLNKAHEMIRRQHMSIQEAAWHVGYESLSSFSNAFAKKFGFRPSEIKG